jgi:hypothetical protein
MFSEFDIAGFTLSGLVSRVEYSEFPFDFQTLRAKFGACTLVE